MQYENTGMISESCIHTSNKIFYILGILNIPHLDMSFATRSQIIVMSWANFLLFFPFWGSNKHFDIFLLLRTVAAEVRKQVSRDYGSPQLSKKRGGAHHPVSHPVFNLPEIWDSRFEAPISEVRSWWVYLF